MQQLSVNSIRFRPHNRKKISKAVDRVDGGMLAVEMALGRLSFLQLTTVGICTNGSNNPCGNLSHSGSPADSNQLRIFYVNFQFKLAVYG